MIVSVYVDDWQLECCGEHVQIGSSVAWHLEDADEVHAVTAVRELVPAWSVLLPVLEVVKQLPDGSEVVAAGRSGLFVEGWRDRNTSRAAAGTKDQSVRVLGPLHEERHRDRPDHLRATSGVVRRIREHWQAYEDSAGPRGGLLPRPGDAALVDTGSTSASRHRVRRDGRRFVGWLVDLAVTPAPGELELEPERGAVTGRERSERLS